MIKNFLQKYTMHIFGILAFVFTFTMGVFVLLENSHALATWLPLGVFVFTLNLFYIKLIRVSRQDYEEALKTEKDYSQNLLLRQKHFLHSVIHETNTPLAVIMANIELYEHEHGKNTTLSNIEAATKNIYGIYDDLSYLTKKDKFSYPKQEIVLATFIQSRIEFFEIVALQSKLTISFQEHANPSTIMINETKLQRIIDNNITNAIKYTKEYEVITIRLYDTHDKCVVEIASSSTIIKDLEQIFDAYYRESLHKEGLGLGLNLVKRICDEESIMIELTSNEDKTSFTYHFKKELSENSTA